MFILYTDQNVADPQHYVNATKVANKYQTLFEMKTTVTMSNIILKFFASIPFFILAVAEATKTSTLRQCLALYSDFQSINECATIDPNSNTAENSFPLTMFENDSKQLNQQQPTALVPNLAHYAARTTKVQFRYAF